MKGSGLDLGTKIILKLMNIVRGSLSFTHKCLFQYASHNAHTCNACSPRMVPDLV